MFRFFTPRRAALLALAGLALPFVIAGCGDTISSVDPGLNLRDSTFVGTYRQDARLYVWPDTPTEVRYFTDLGTPGPSTADTLESIETIYRSGMGTVQSMLLDGSPASGFEFYRTARNGGLEPMRDYVVNAPRKWLDSHWELYELTDKTPSGYAPPTYIARGLLAGETTKASPLTNAARITTSTTKTLQYTGSLFPARSDSNFTLKWSPVTGAAGYWMHVYQFRSDALVDEYIRSGTPSPVWNGKVRDIFVGYIAAPATEFKLGTPGALVLTYKPPISGQLYEVRVTAVDDQGQLVAGMGTDFSRLTISNEGSFLNITGSGYSIQQEEGRWKIFSLGAALVNPGGTATGPNLGIRPAGTAGLTLYPGSSQQR